MGFDYTTIHPELRFNARIMRLFIPEIKPGVFKNSYKRKEKNKGRCSLPLRYEQIYIPRAGDEPLRLCVYSPLEQKENVPGLLWIHGGGYAFGIPEGDETRIKKFIDASGCVVVSPDYTLSSRKPYPAALNDCYAALLWLRDNGANYGMRRDQMFVGGGSAGGGLAAAIAVYARDKGEVNIAFQMPLYPMIDDRAAKSNKDAPLWNAKTNENGWRLYLGGLYGKDVPVYAAPARCTDYHGLPPACTFAGDIELFYDETAAYIENLKKCGIPVHFKVFKGCYHGFDNGKSKIAGEADEYLMSIFKYAVTHYFAKAEDKNHV